jgi:GT2 family glycosyltransferase
MSSHDKPVTVCVPVLKRYDLLAKLLESLEASTVLPDAVYIIDNGRSPKKLAGYMGPLTLMIHEPSAPLGVAASWNWFINHVDEDRLIVNDDVTFGPSSLERIRETPGDLVSGLFHAHAAFSCFLIRDSCIRTVGTFDETISPGYAYFEDCDYEERMGAAGILITPSDCGVEHVKSQTLAVASAEELADHHRRFIIAQENFLRKWGRLPYGVERQTA